MKRLLSALLLAALMAGCSEPNPYVPSWVMDHPEYGRHDVLDRSIESSYRDYVFELDGSSGVEGDPEASRAELIERIRRKYEHEALRTLYSVVVGQPPYENKVGYLEKVEYPRVLIYDRDMGVYDPLQLRVHYVYDLSLEEPVGFVSDTGLTVRFRRKNEVDDSRLGKFTPGVGAVYVLGVCPSTGVVLSPDWIFPQIRTDIDPSNLNRIKEITARELTRLHRYYRTVHDLDPSFHKSVHGLIVMEEGKGDYGFRDIIPVRLVELESSDFHKKGMDRAPLRTVPEKKQD